MKAVLGILLSCEHYHHHHHYQHHHHHHHHHHHILGSPSQQPVVDEKDEKRKRQRNSQLEKMNFLKHFFLFFKDPAVTGFFYTLFMVYEQLLGKQGCKISDPENRR